MTAHTDGSDALLEALRVPRHGRVYQLSLVLNNDRPMWPVHGPFLHFNLHSYVQGSRLVTGAANGTPPFGMLVDRVEMPLHAGTHVDALNHIAVDDRLHDGSRASEMELSSGARTLGIDTVSPFIARGVLLDVAAVHGRPMLSGDHEIGPDDLERALRLARIELAPGDVVLIHTGWMDLYETNRRAYFEREPGLGSSGATMLAEAGVRGVGADNSALELVPSGDADRPYPVHEELLARKGVHLFENVVTTALAADHVTEFLFLAIPLPIRGGTGSPLTPVAIT